MNERLKQCLIESENFPETLFPIVEAIGHVLADELYTGGYSISDKTPEQMRLITNDDTHLINLYDDGESSFAVYSLPELNKNIVEPLKALGFEVVWDSPPVDNRFFEAFPVGKFMEFVGNYIPSAGLVTDGYDYWDTVSSEDTEYAVEYWFDDFSNTPIEDEYHPIHREVVRFLERYGSYDRDGDYNSDSARETIVLEWLADNLRSFVNSWDNDRDCFFDMRSMSQWQVFCEISGYPEKEDYFCVLSIRENYDKLYSYDTYISYENAVKEVQDWHEKSETKILDVFKLVEEAQTNAIRS